MNVTEEVLRNHLIYGGSDSARSEYNAATKSLNYANGGSLQNAIVQTVGSIPYNQTYEDAVGLFGTENYFLKFDCNVTTSTLFLDEGNETNDYLEAVIDPNAPELDEFYNGSNLNTTVESDIGWQPAQISQDSRLPNIGPDAYISVDLNNLKTGNKYIDCWLDVRLYTRSREEHPYDKMYVRINDEFYLGVHARNTRRLPYNINLLIGNQYLTYDQIPQNEREFIMKSSR